MFGDEHFFAGKSPISPGHAVELLLNVAVRVDRHRRRADNGRRRWRSLTGVRQLDPVAYEVGAERADDRAGFVADAAGARTGERHWRRAAARDPRRPRATRVHVVDAQRRHRSLDVAHHVQPPVPAAGPRGVRRVVDGQVSQQVRRERVGDEDGRIAEQPGVRQSIVWQHHIRVDVVRPRCATDGLLRRVHIGAGRYARCRPEVEILSVIVRAVGFDARFADAPVSVADAFVAAGPCLEYSYAESTRQRTTLAVSGFAAVRTRWLMEHGRHVDEHPPFQTKSGVVAQRPVVVHRRRRGDSELYDGRRASYELYAGVVEADWFDVIVAFAASEHDAVGRRRRRIQKLVANEIAVSVELVQTQALKRPRRNDVVVVDRRRHRRRRFARDGHDRAVECQRGRPAGRLVADTATPVAPPLRPHAPAVVVRRRRDVSLSIRR